MMSPDRALRPARSSYTTSARRCFGVLVSSAGAAVGAVLAQMVEVVAVDGLADLFVVVSGKFGHQHSEAGVPLHPEFGFRARR